MNTHWQFNRKSTADEVVAGHNLSGQTVIVTGANTGIGYETARALASAGARVILACRNPETGNEAVQRIKAAHPNANAEFAAIDLGSLPSVRQFCESVDAEVIDQLICNAGSMAMSYMETEQGFERTVGVCHVGHFLLAQLLMPKILAADTPRVIMLSSEAHKNPETLDFDNLPYSENNYSAMKAYGQAKLCNALMALELQNRYGDQGLTACSVHPGNMVTTDFGRETAFMRFAFKLMSPFTKTPNQGAATGVYCAVHEPRAELAAGYFSHCQPAPCTDEAKNHAAAARLWEISEGWVR